MAYKFGSDKDKDTTSEYAKWYNSDRSNSDIYDYIHLASNHKHRLLDLFLFLNLVHSLLIIPIKIL